MNIIHLSDTHLGYSAYRKINKHSINQREHDLYQAFTNCIDYALQNKPDLILHSGDLFDSVRPTNRAINHAITQLLRLSKQNIPTIIISGNHETPRLQETGHIFTILDHIDHIHPIYHNKYETKTFTIKKHTITIHALPHCTTKQTYQKNLTKITPNTNADYNILTTHAAVQEIKEFSMNEFNENFLPTKKLNEQYNYIALGHYHNHTNLQNNASYPGSPERLTFAEANHPKGLIHLTLTPQKTTTKFIQLPTRPMIDLPPLHCHKLTPNQITHHITTQLQQHQTQGTIIRLTLTNLPQHIQRSIDYHHLKNITKDTLHFELKTTTQNDTQQRHTTHQHHITSLTQEYLTYLQQQKPTETNLLKKLGIEYITKYETNQPEP